MIRFEFATNIHVEMIRLLAEEIWWEHFPGIISDAQIKYMLKWMYSTPKIKQELLENKVWLVFFDKDTPIGYVSYFLENTDTVFLSKIYLKKDFQGKGIGNRMLELAMDYGIKKGASKLYLTVNIHNKIAINFYERRGFVKTDAVKKEIGNGFCMDDYVYTIPIPIETIQEKTGT